MWDLIVSVPDHCYLFTLLSLFCHGSGNSFVFSHGIEIKHKIHNCLESHSVFVS